MNYAASVSDFFRSPKWATNLLLGGLFLFVPLLGPIVVLGWLVTGFWTRRDTENFRDFPPFEFSQFETYLERGLWPCLVTLIAGMAMVPVI